MGTRFVTAAEFQANCQTYLNALEKDADTTITITRKGSPVGVLSPVVEPKKTPKKVWGLTRKNWRGKIKIADDIADIDMTQFYECLK